MPKCPDLPCADCGKPMWRGTTSLPAGQARCIPCRRIARGFAPDQSIATQQVRKIPKHVACQRCSAPIDDPRRFRYCSNECFRKARNARGSGGVSRLSTAARGYDYAHQLLRARLLPSAYGTPCSLCGEVMDDADSLHLDHNEERTGYRGIVHARCNILDGARRGGATVRARKLAVG